MSIDPYTVLGVPKDADAAAIKAAWKKIASKTHPDVGGREEDFLAAKEANEILSDPARRAYFDEHGFDLSTIESNRRAEALQVIGGMVAEIINRVFHNGYSNLKGVDFIGSIRNGLNKDVESLHDGRAAAARMQLLLKDMLKRLSTTEQDDPIACLCKTRLRKIDEDLAGMEETLATRQMALEIIKTYNFRIGDPCDEDRMDRPRSRTKMCP